LADTNYTNFHESENKALMRRRLREWLKPRLGTLTKNKGVFLTGRPTSARVAGRGGAMRAKLSFGFD
jgi:hypothetical protein